MTDECRRLLLDLVRELERWGADGDTSDLDDGYSAGMGFAADLLKRVADGGPMHAHEWQPMATRLGSREVDGRDELIWFLQCGQRCWACGEEREATVPLVIQRRIRPNGTFEDTEMREAVG